MIKLVDDRREVLGISLGAIWVGGSDDEKMLANGNKPYGIGASLNVAQDLVSMIGWYHHIESMHVGLIDGDGNELCTYIAAVLALHALLKRHNTLIYCHTGTRALTIAIMYLSAYTGKPYLSFDNWRSILGEKSDIGLPMPIGVHIEAYEKMNWIFLKEMMGN